MSYDEIAARVRIDIASRGARTIRGISRIFRQLDSFDENARVDAQEMQTGLTEAGVEITLEEVEILIA